MPRLRAVAYGASVAVAVFVYLALPTLRQLYGPVVNLPAYALVALLAGGLTYSVMRRLARPERRERADPTEYLEEPLSADDAEDGGGPTDEDIDRELETIREDQ